MGTASAERRLEKDRAKALRALKLWERGHDLLSISQMAGIPVGSVTKRIDLGRRLRGAGIKQMKVIKLPNWQQRVYRLASRQLSMGHATAFCRQHNIAPSPTLMVWYNPHWSN